MAVASPNSGWSPTTRPGGLAELAFDGSNDVVITRNALSLPRADAPMTLAIWGRLRTTTGTKVLMALSDFDGVASNLAQLELRGGIFGYAKNGGQPLVQMSIPPVVDQWFHLGATWDGTTNKLFYNGLLQNSTTTTHNTGALNLLLAGNYQTGAAENWDGALDDLRVYTRPLTDAEMWALYLASSTGYLQVLRHLRIGNIQASSLLLQAARLTTQAAVHVVSRDIVTIAPALRTQAPLPTTTTGITLAAPSLRTQAPAPATSRTAVPVAPSLRTQAPAPASGRTAVPVAPSLRTQAPTLTAAPGLTPAAPSLRTQAPMPLMTDRVAVPPAISARARGPTLTAKLIVTLQTPSLRTQAPALSATPNLRVAAPSLRTQTVAPLIPRTGVPETPSLRTQTPAILVLGNANPPAIVARAQIPAPLTPRIANPPAIIARAQVPGSITTRRYRVPVVRARAQTPTPLVTIGRANRPDNPLLTSTFVPGDWLIQAPDIAMRLSFDFQDEASAWDHRILDISPIEMSVPPGGGIATVANVTIKIAEDRARQSILQLWQQYPTINGVPLTIDFLVVGASALPGVSNPLRVFTGKIDTITLKDAIADILCVDDSIQQNLLIPQTLVTSAAFPQALSATYGQPEPLIYGAGANIGAAPLLLVDIPTNTYLIAGHPMYLGSGNIAVWDQANTIFMAASGVLTFTNDASALVTFGVVNTGILSWGSAVGVTDGGNAVDGNSTTIAVVNTGTLDSNGAGYGALGIFETTAGTPNTNILQIALTNHRRSPGSDPTVNGTFYVQTINPTTGALLRTLFTTSAYRHVTSAQTDIITLSNTRIAINEQLEVKLIARNDGTLGTTSQTYEVGEVQAFGIVLYSATSAGLTTMTLPFNTQEIRFNTISYPLTLDVDHTDTFVITPSNAVDLFSTTYAIIPTCALDSNLDGVGQLTVATPVTSGQLGNNTLSIDFTNHRRSLSSTPTVTGTFFVQTVNPATTTVLRDNLFVSPPYRQQLNPLSTSFTAPAVNLGANEQLAVRVLARNEGGIGSYNAGQTSLTALASTVSFVLAFGSAGTGPGGFEQATYMALDTAGNPWVVDFVGNRVQQFNAAGTFLQQFGTTGYGPGQFIQPLGIAIDAVNQIYVTDTFRAQVQIFTSNGMVISGFGVFGSADGQFIFPYGVTAAPDGTIWVTDGLNHSLQQFTSLGTFIQKIGTMGSGDGQFMKPAGIQADAGGTLWVADGDNFRVQALTNTGTFLRKFGSIGTGQGQFSDPEGIAAGISGTIWVTDSINNTIQRFTSAGSYLLTAGSGGVGNGQFQGAVGVAVSGSTLWVVDTNNKRVQKLLVSSTSTVQIVTSGANDAYEVGEIGIKSFYQPAGGNLPVFLYGGSWLGRYDNTGVIVSYAGLPSGRFFHTPDEVIASILTQEMGRSVTTSAFANAYTWYTHRAYTFDGGLGAGWSVTREQARKVLGDAAQQAAAILYPNFDNSFKLVPFRSDAPIHLAFSVSNILLEDGAEKNHAGPWHDTMQITLGNLQMVHNSFEIRYAYNAGSRSYGKIMTVDKSGSTLITNAQYKVLVEGLCFQSFARHGDLQPLIIDAYWLADDASAQYLLAFLVQYFSGQRTFVEFDTTMYAASLQVGDFITVDHPLLPLNDNGGTFEVHTIRYLPLIGRIHLVASKVATLSTVLRPNDQSVGGAAGVGAGAGGRARAQIPNPLVQQLFTPTYAWSILDNDDAHMGALDASGRIFMWGEAGISCYTGQTPVAIPGTSNFSPHAALYGTAPILQMQYPYQVGSKSNYVDLQSKSDGMNVARDADGFLYMWGFDLGDFFDISSRYEFQTGGKDARKFLANTLGYEGLELLTLRLMNTIQWIDFALGWTNILGVKADGTVWVWGSNQAGTEFGMPAYPAGYKTKSPLQVQGLPASPAKLVRADDGVSVVVTEADEIWVWGEFATELPLTIPTQWPLTLPAGVTIVSVRISSYGLVVLLSNGQVYARGQHIAFVSAAPYVTSSFLPAPGSHVFTSIDVHARNAGGIDVNKDLWGWGDDGLGFLSRNSAFCDVSSTDPILITTATPGQYAWKTFSIGLRTHTAATISGQLMAWGANDKGALGIGLTDSQFLHTCSPVSTMAPIAHDGSMA